MLFIRSIGARPHLDSPMAKLMTESSNDQIDILLVGLTDYSIDNNLPLRIYPN